MLFFESFPPIFFGKRYKLINFAPKYVSVDKCRRVLIFKKKISTAGVDSLKPQSNNFICKKKDRKFSTYKRHIIILHFILF